MTTTGIAPWGTPNLQPETKNYVTNNLNQYSEITSLQTPVPNTLSYDYDGNLTQSAEGTIGTKYTYNAENRLISVEPQVPTSGTTKVECSYDYMGRRVEKKVFNYVAGDWQLKTDTWFLYDGWNLISESTTVTGQQSPVVKCYVWGLDLSQSLQGAGGVGGLIAVVDNGEAYHYFYDANGNVVQLVKASDGSIAAHYEYDLYGNIIVKSGLFADDNPIRFSTKFFDDETGLGYWGYRHYSPNLGRWISRDPIEERGGVNLYASFNNDPVNNYDLTGNISFGFASKFVFHYFFGGGKPLVVWDDGGEIKQSPEYKIYIADVIEKNSTRCKNVAKSMKVNEQRLVQVVQPNSGIVLNDFWSLQTIGGSLGPLKFIGALKINKSSQCLATCEFDGIVLWIDTADMHPDLWASDSSWKKWQKIGIGKEYDYTISWRDTFKADVMPSNDMP